MSERQKTSKEKEPMWVSCRAGAAGEGGCGGQQALLMHKRDLQMGNVSLHFKCTRCNRPFVITH